MAAELAVLQNLVVMLDERSISHCHYRCGGAEAGAPMTAAVAGRVREFASANKTALTLLYARQAPPAELEACFAQVPSARIVPLPLAALYPGALVVVDREDWDSLALLPDNRERNIVLRLPREELHQLPLMVRRLLRKCRRLNLCLLGVEEMKDTDLELYRAMIADTAAIMATEYRQGREIELNALSDRLLLSAMNNCDAGLKHLTVSPDGKLHLCPGFHRERPEDAVGDITAGPGIPNPELLRLDHAPICSICDAFQCRRCALLNKTLTLEINTPSRQQCVLSHLEREASRRLLADLADHEDFKKLPAIPALNYLDPFEELMARRSPKAVAPPSAIAAAKTAVPQPRLQRPPLSPATGDIVVKNGGRTFSLPRLGPLKPGSAAPASGSVGPPELISPKPANLDTSSARDLVSKLVEQQKDVLATLEKLLKELS
jgi:CXXX repeat peptide maturase